MKAKFLFKVLFILTVLFIFLKAPAYAQSPMPRINPIVWKTSYNKFSSSNFYIKIGNRYYYGGSDLNVRSDPGTDRTTLEISWHENDVEMRFYLYFRRISNNMWELYEMRTYNGNLPGDWIYYKVEDGSKITGVVGEAYHAASKWFKPIIPGTDAEVACVDCTITAFISNILPISPYGYSLDFRIGLPPDETITVSTNPMTGYGVNGLLMDDKSNVVTDQSNFRYAWRVINWNIASIFPQSIPYPDGKCAYGILPPCPEINIQIAGVSPGVTQIVLDVVRKSDNVVVASNSFDVKVIDKDSTLPTSTPEPTLGSKPIDDGDKIKEELKELRGEVGRVNIELKQQREDISGIRKMVNSIIEFLNMIFGKIFKGR